MSGVWGEVTWETFLPYDIFFLLVTMPTLVDGDTMNMAPSSSYLRERTRRGMKGGKVGGSM